MNVIHRSILFHTCTYSMALPERNELSAQALGRQVMARGYLRDLKSATCLPGESNFPRETFWSSQANLSAHLQILSSILSSHRPCSHKDLFFLAPFSSLSVTLLR